MKKIFLVDMDGVIADQHGWFLELLKRDHPDIYATYSGTDEHYEFEQNFPSEHHALIKSLRNQEGFFRDLPLIGGAKEALEEMQRNGHDVYICTAPIWEYRFCVPEKFNWVEQHLGRDWVMRVLTARDKTIVHADYLIDDKEVVDGKHIPSWEHVIFDRPYNKTSPRRRIDWSNWGTLLEK